MTSNHQGASVHALRVSELTTRVRTLESRADRISFARLVLFLAAAVTGFAGVSQGATSLLSLALVLAAGFGIAVIAHARVHEKKRELDERIACHQRHLARWSGKWTELPSRGEGLLPADHDYASDIDLVGAGSLFQRIDVTQTQEGEYALARALGSPLTLEQIPRRQAAVEDLANRPAFREAFEVLGRLGQTRGKKLDHSPFMTLLAQPSLFAAHRWLKPAMYVLVATTATMLVLAQLDVIADGLVWLPLLVQGALLLHFKEPVHHVLDVITARAGFAQAYGGMLKAIEDEKFEAPYLVDLRASLAVSGQPPSAHMARLARYEGFAQLRTQGPFYLVLNVLTLWDLFCLERIERLTSDVRDAAEPWFLAVGEVEMLCSLATLRSTDPRTTYPKLAPAGSGLRARGLQHPLLSPEQRVPNDVTLDGPSSLLIVTGSNMAGKSTLLRATGLNVALALAGGPVCAEELTLAPVRLRASMRIDDSLQRGASYFHAELTKLRMVVRDVDAQPPVLFLLDELLRGTNARARHAGARAVLLHLLSRGAMGIVATHDIPLASLDGELEHVHNVHFTDVFEHGEMLFDYKLRDGVVKTSNALRLLAMAGIDVPVDDAVG